MLMNDEVDEKTKENLNILINLVSNLYKQFIKFDSFSYDCI